jgi:hypothetical protein
MTHREINLTSGLPLIAQIFTDVEIPPANSHREGWGFVD